MLIVKQHANLNVYTIIDPTFFQGFIVNFGTIFSQIRI
jgi:hypothetical protein